MISLEQFASLQNVTTLDISFLNREVNIADIRYQHVNDAPQIETGMLPRKRKPRVPKRRVVPIYLPPKVQKLLAKDCNFETEVNEGVEIHFTNNSLKCLDLSKNRIGKLMGTLSGLEKLETFDMSENICDNFSPKFSQYMPKLKTLILRDNHLRLDTNDFTENHFENLEYLDLSLNRINKIPYHALNGFPVLKSLSLRGNLIYDFNVKVNHMRNLSHLDLSDNMIDYLPRGMTAQLDVMPYGSMTLNLTGNPLMCTCNTLDFIQWVCSTRVSLDKQNLHCVLDNDRKQNTPIADIMDELKSQCKSHVGIAMGCLVGVTGSMVIIIMAMVYRFRWKVRYLYYIVRGKYRNILVNQQRDDTAFDYDAFIAYDEEDTEFACMTFINKLEEESQLRLCLHQRDFHPGEFIASNVLSSIQRSRHVVIVLSPNFLDSYWCRWEFEMARMEGLYTERNVVILVRYQEVLPSVVPRDMLYMMHTQTYLEYPEGQQDQDTFWTALRQAIEDN